MAAETARVIETVTVSAEHPSTGGATHDVPLQLYTFRGTRWLSGDIVMAMWEAMRVLEQCGVVLAGAELRLLDAPSRFHVYFTPVSRELLGGMAVIKPAIFFVADTRNQPAYDAEAVGQGNSATRPELMNTVWIAYGARDLPLAIAHELVHLLSDSGDHSNEPGNLMQPESSPENTRLSDTQCQRLRARGEANGLLKRR
jgi:hypothetical protein